MPKGYLIAHINIHDKEGFEEFRKMSLPVITKYEGKALIRNPNPDLREGSNPVSYTHLTLPTKA